MTFAKENVNAGDALARQTTVRDPRHGSDSVSETHYNSAGQVDWTEDAANNRTTLAYESATGRLAIVTDANSKATRYTYNLRGQQTRAWGDVPLPTETGYDSTYGERTTLSTYRGGSGWNGSSWCLASVENGECRRLPAPKVSDPNGGRFDDQATPELHRSREDGDSAGTPIGEDADIGRVRKARSSADRVLPVAEKTLRGWRHRV